MAKPSKVFPAAVQRVSLALEESIPVPYSVKVGVRGAEASAPKKPHEGEPPTGLTLVEVATWHEFGLGNNPERSFLRAWVDENQDRVLYAMRALGKKLIMSEITEQQVADVIGLLAQSGVQEYIAIASNFQELNEEYARRKGSSSPLIDTGQLRSGITYETKTGESK